MSTLVEIEKKLWIRDSVYFGLTTVLQNEVYLLKKKLISTVCFLLAIRFVFFFFED